MKVLQLIDTLNPGGAERMALNYANSLSEVGIESYLVSTRSRGEFVKSLNQNVNYFFLERKKIFDFKAIKKLKRIINTNQIDIVHAHGTSWFIASLCKMRSSNFKLIWHNHYGNSVKMNVLKKNILLRFSVFFDGVISVNNELHLWSENFLRCKNSIHLPNYIDPVLLSRDKTLNGLNLVCIANLRQEKNHKLLLDALDILKTDFDLMVHFIGREYKDEYSENIKNEFKKRKDYVIFHNSISDPNQILISMDIGVLVSKYEGMPMALLEYGAASLAVIATNVGVCEKLLKNRGVLIESENLNQLVEAIRTYAANRDQAKSDSIKFHNFIVSNYTSRVIIPKYLNFCKSIC